MTRLGSPYLTDGYSDPETVQRIKLTRSGMASWAASGPPDTTCGTCRHLNDKMSRSGNLRRKLGCLMYLSLTGVHGDSVPPATPSCHDFAKGE